MTSIAIISDNASFTEKLEKSLILLRQNDTILKYDFSEFKVLRSDVRIVLLYTESTDKLSVDFINKVKNDQNYLILFIPDINDKLILELYDRGINEFCRPEASVYSVLVKIINAQKQLAGGHLKDCYKNILTSKGILKENSSVCRDFGAVFCHKMKNFIEKSAILAVDIPHKFSEKFIAENLENRLVSALRTDDIVLNYSDFSYILVLSGAGFDSAHAVFDKLTNILGIPLNGMLIRYKSFNENELMCKINNLRVLAQKDGVDFIVEAEETSCDTEKDWLDTSLDIDKPQNFKFFQAIYNSKLEKIIRPVFFRLKEKYENLDSGIKIEFLIEKNTSDFYINSDKRSNYLKIIFENSPVLRFQLNYSGIYTPENADFTLPFSQLTIKKLTEIMESFIADSSKDELKVKQLKS